MTASVDRSVVQSYRACTIKRSRRSKADIDDIKRAIIDVIRPAPPMTVRHVFYQLVTRGVIEKTEKEYQQTVIRLIAEMRIAGELKWSWITAGELLPGNSRLVHP